MPTLTSASATVWSCAASSASTAASRRSSTDDAPAAARNVSATHAAGRRRACPRARRSGGWRRRPGGRGTRRGGARSRPIPPTRPSARCGRDRRRTRRRWRATSRPRRAGRAARGSTARLGREPAERAEPVVESDDDDVVGGELRAVVDRERRGADAVAPPGTHTSTGASPRAGRAKAVEISAVRQSSDCESGIIPGTRSSPPTVCGGAAPGWVASNGSVHVIGSGSPHRSARAYGTPPKRSTSPCRPTIGPTAVSTVTPLSRHWGRAARPRAPGGGTAPTRSAT